MEYINQDIKITEGNMQIVAISDTHGKHSLLKIPECDILLHAGDFTYLGDPEELEDFSKWLDKQPADYIVITPGNHEVWLEKNWEEGCNILNRNCSRLIILNDSSIKIEELNIYGSPITPTFGVGWAWNRNRGKAIQEHWNKIPIDTDILLTHSPAYGILDITNIGAIEEHCGCFDLLKTIQDKVKPLFHICGHLHDGHGLLSVNNTTYINASVLDDYYSLAYKPTVLFA
jgi:Icc-related predicted phosphoesterase